MTVYFLSGLGADRRVFKSLQFNETVKVEYLDWMAPEFGENLVGYAKRMSLFLDTNSPYILIGYSFGGILATEMLRFIQPQKTILISSVARRQELPWYYRFAGKLNLHLIFPENASNRVNELTYWSFGAKSSTDKVLLREVLESTDTAFSKWAINQILKWERKSAPPDLIRIHGDRDYILPIIGFIPKYKISDGAHFMVSSKASLISEILDKEIML